MKNAIHMLAMAAMAALVWFGACTPEDTQIEKARIRVLLTDGPGDYQEVNIDVRDVKVNFLDDEEQGWTSLDEIHPGVYNLLDLTAGLDTILGEAELNPGPLKQIRLILGEENTLKVDDAVHDLKTPSAQQSGLKIKLNEVLEPGVTYTILLDFDAARSVVKAGNSGKYNLKPVIRASVEAETGSIGGMIMPAGVQSLVYAVNATDSLSTFTNEEGKFLIRGVPAGTYKVTIEPETNSGYMNKSIEDVGVNIGQKTDLGSIELN